MRHTILPAIASPSQGRAHGARFALLLVLSLAGHALAEQSEQFGDYEVHYSVVNTTFVAPEVSARYGITRGRNRAFLNVAVRQRLPDGSTAARPASLEGRTWDLFQNQFLEFREIREAESIYYLGDFKFSDGDLRFFDVTVHPEGAGRSYQLRFQHKVYVD